MRVITGIYKGRHFEIPRTFKARPTTDFAKENLFNVLRGYTNIEGAEVLDLFAGTGSITAEFLSRECASVTSVELDREHYAFIGAVVKKLGAENCRLLRGDALRFIKRATKKFDIVFCRPSLQTQRACRDSANGHGGGDTQTRRDPDSRARQDKRLCRPPVVL